MVEDPENCVNTMHIIDVNKYGPHLGINNERNYLVQADPDIRHITNPSP